MSNIKKSFIATVCAIVAMLALAGCSKPDTPPPPPNDTTTAENVNPTGVYSDNPVKYNLADAASVIQYSDGFFYFESYQIETGKRMMRNTDIYRYNPETKLLTHICKDAVCDHKSPDCPLFGHMTAYVYNNKLYFDKNYRYTRASREDEIFMGFASYDLVGGELKKLKVDAFEVSENPTTKLSVSLKVSAIYCDEYRFYYENDYNEELKADVKAMKRMNLDTGEVTIINDNCGETLKYLFFYDGRLYSTDMKCLFSTDMDGKDKKIIAEGIFDKGTVTNGKVIVWRDEASGELHAMNMDGSNSRSLGIKSENFKLNERNLYYFSDEEIETGKIAESGKAEKIRSFELFRYSFEDGKSELLFDTRTDDGVTSFTSFEVVNGRFYGRYSKWTFPAAGERWSHKKHRYLGTTGDYVNTIMCIDLASGEQSLIELTLD